jgi:hypothetical protein
MTLKVKRSLKSQAFFFVAICLTQSCGGPPDLLRDQKLPALGTRKDALIASYSFPDTVNGDGWSALPTELFGVNGQSDFQINEFGRLKLIGWETCLRDSIAATTLLLRMRDSIDRFYGHGKASNWLGHSYKWRHEDQKFWLIRFSDTCVGLTIESSR